MPKVRPEDKQLKSGLPDDFDGTITTDTHFGVRDEYVAVAGIPDPMLILSIDSEELPEQTEQGYSLGGRKQWREVRGGKEVVSAADPDLHSFTANSRGGQLVTAMATAIGEGDSKKGMEVLFKRDVWMTEAPFYYGYRFHWNRKPLETVSGETRDVLLPTSYLGEEVQPGPVAEDDALAHLLKIAEGLTERELKRVILKDEVLNAATDLKNAVFNRGLLKTLVEEGKLTVGPNGKYV